MSQLNQTNKTQNNNNEFTIVENNCRPNIDIKDLYGRCITTYDGATHYHFNTPTFYLRKSREKTIVLDDPKMRITIMKPKKKQLIKLTTSEFDALLREYGFKSEERMQSLNEVVKRPISRPPKLVLRATEDVAEYVIRDFDNFRGVQFSVAVGETPLGKGYAEVLARARNKLMHSLNGNIDSENQTMYTRSYELEGKVHLISLTLSENQVNELFNCDYIENDVGSPKIMEITLYTFYKPETRVKMEIDHIMNYKFDGTVSNRNKFFKILSPMCKIIKINRNNIAIDIVSTETEKRAVMTTSTGFKIGMCLDDFQYVGENVEIKLNSFAAEQYDSFKFAEQNFKGEKVIQIQEAEQLRRTTIWSNHLDYDPYKRCVIGFQNEVKIKLFNMQEPDFYLGGTSEGSWQYHGSFLLVPKNTCWFKFSKVTYTGHVVNSNLYRRVLSSVTNQQMTEDQIAKTALMLTRIQCSYINFEKTYDSIFSIIYQLLKSNINALTCNKDYSYTIGNIWDIIFRTPTPFEVFPVEINKSLEQNIIQTKTKIELTQKSLKELSETYFKNIEEIDSVPILIKLFRGGVLTSMLNHIRPLKWHISSMPTAIYSETTELNEQQEFIKNIVEAAVDEVDLTICINQALSILELKISRGEIKQVQKFRKIILNLASFRFDSMYQPGLNKLATEISKIDKVINKEEIALKNKLLINRELQKEKILVSIMSSHYFSFANLLGIRPGNSPFNTVDYIFNISNKLRTKVTQCHWNGPSASELQEQEETSDDESEEDSDSEDEEEQPTTDEAGVFRRFYNKFRVPFDNISNGLKKLYHLDENIDTIKQEIFDKVDQVAGQFDNVQMRNVAKSLKSLKFDNIRNSYYSIELLIKGFMNDFINKLGSLFGIEIECNLEPAKLFAFYLLWNNTDCNIVRYYIIGTIAVELGIMDLFMSLIGKIYTAIKKFFTVKTIKKQTATKKAQKAAHAANAAANQEMAEVAAVNSKPVEEGKTMKSSNFKSIIDSINIKTLRLEKQNKEKILEEKKKVDEVVDQEIEKEEWLDYICRKISEGTPALIGTVAVVIATVLGVKVAMNSDKNSVGNQITQGLRNLSFYGLGLAAMPKIFQYFMGIANWIVEKAKELLNKDYLSKDRYIKKLTDWLKKTNYCKGVTEQQFVRNTTFTAEFFENFIEMRYLLEKDTLLMGMSDLKVAWGKRVQLMNELFPVASSAMQIALGSHEIFHVQLTSQPGYGKTDMSNQLLESLKATFNKLEDETAKSIGMVKKHFSSGKYPFKETLNHADMYYGQNFATLDEDYVFNNPSQEQIVDKMFLLSGFPCISQQASLADKGRMFDIKVMLSNTNNPYMRPQNMINPAALHRRRHLFRVKLKDEFAMEGANANEYIIDEKKIIDAKINRTRGDHLLVDYLDSLKDEVVTIGDFRAENMSVDQAKELICALLQKQYQTEEQRLLNRDGTQCYARIAYEKLMQDLKHWDIELGKDEMLTTASVFTSVSKKIQDFDLKFKNAEGVSDAAKKEHAEKLKQKMIKDIEVVSKVIPYIKQEDDAISLLNTEQVAYFGEAIDETNYSLGIKEINNQRYYYLQPGIMKARKGPINFYKLQIHETNLQSGSKIQMIYYPVGDSDDVFSILYWLIEFSACRNEEHFKREIGIRRMELVNTSKLKIWKEKLKVIHYRTLTVCEKALKFLTSCAIDYIGKPLFQGMLVGITIVGMFYTLGAIGTLLAPKTQNVAYTNVVRTNRVPTATARSSTGVNQIKQEIEVENPITPFVAKQNKSNDTGLTNCDDSQFMRDATYKIRYYAKKDNGKVVEIIGTIIGLKGNLFLTCRHNVDKIKESINPVELEVYDSKYSSNPNFTIKKYFIRSSDIEYIKDEDAAIMVIKGFRATRDITDHFVTENDLGNNMQNFVTGECLSVILKRQVFDNTNPNFEKWKSTGWSRYIKTLNYTKTNPRPTKVIEFNTKASVESGDSGSLVMHDNNKVQRKFIGLIFAAGDQVYVNVITKEDIESVAKRFDPTTKIVVTVTSEEVLPEDHELYKVFKYKDQLYKGPYGNVGISQSAGFRKTPIHGCFKDSTEYEVFPAIQNLNDPRWKEGTRHPFYVSLNKTAGEKNPTFDLKEEKFMKSALEHMYKVHTPGINQIRSFNTTEAIVGVRMRGSTSMNTKTTPGLPYSLERSKKGKTDYIHFHEQTQSWQISDFVFNEVNHYETRYNLGLVPLNYKHEFLKKELVPIAKIEDPKTRTVATGNMCHQIIYNKLFKNLYIFFKNSWEYGQPTPIALGLDPPRHWHMITEHLKYLDYVMDFDVKAWEEKLNLRLMTMNAEVKTKLYEDAYKSRGEKLDLNYKMLSTGLVVDYTDAYVCFRDIMYRKASGLLSGHPGTLMENSEIHYMILNLIAYRILMRYQPQYANVHFIYDHVRCILAADDVLIAVSPLARNYITCERIVEEYNKLGFEITSADKKSEIRPKNIEQVQFLKNSFNNIEGIYYPKPNMSIIIQLFSWYREDSSLSPQEQMQVNRENAFAQLWWRGKEDYERVRSEFNIINLKRNYQWSLDYEQMAALLEQQNLDKEYNSQIPNNKMDDGEEILDEILYN